MIVVIARYATVTIVSPSSVVRPVVISQKLSKTDACTCTFYLFFFLYFLSSLPICAMYIDQIV